MLAGGGCTVLIALVLAACGSSSNSPGTASASTGPGEPGAPPSPAGDLFAPPSPLPSAQPGTLIWAEKVDQPKLDPPATIWRILYHSQDRTGADIAVSGFAIVPASAPPSGGRPVYAWAHGAQGQADQCAPSKSIADNLPPYGGQQVEAGSMLVATDYQGLGTPGEPTYLVGTAEGHAVLDSVRAARQLPGAGPPGPVVFAGVSQGGGAALWAGELAHTYSPELDVRGVVAIAPAAELPTILANIGQPPFNAYLGNVLLASDGLHAGYGGSFDPSQFLTTAALSDLNTVSKECADATVARWQGRPLDTVVAHDPESIPALAKVLADNSPGQANPGVPVLIVQGSKDAQIPPVVSDQLHQRYCAVGANVALKVYPGADHDSVLEAAMEDVIKWIADRRAGRTTQSDC
jgi:pimeloyl-ACP methyl ester carboxylesterase